MSNETLSIDDVRNAVNKAKWTIDAANREVAAMAALIQGRLREAGTPIYVLTRLKKELADFNMHTGCWKD